MPPNFYSHGNQKGGLGGENLVICLESADRNKISEVKNSVYMKSFPGSIF